MTDDEDSALRRGADLIRRTARTLPDAPGVYRMLDARGEALYVGKARSLRRRVASYANIARLPLRLQRMVSLTCEMAFVRTHTEVEALLLESNLIKKLKPRYNILMRDDKSFPYLLMTGDHDFPRLVKHRGARSRAGDYYGPFASGDAVNRTLLTLQKAFMLRTCSDNVFAGRTRPCLQYHIKRCTAPCVGLVGVRDYAAQVREARDFLAGKSSAIQELFAQQMQAASEATDYEAAASYRDRIKALTAIQARQDVNVKGVGDADVIGFYRAGSKSCVQVFFFRGGQNFGNRSYFPRHDEEDGDGGILAAFIAQFYENKLPPPEIVLSHKADDVALIEEALHEREGRRVRIVTPQGGARRRLADFAAENARDALEREAARLAGDKALLASLAALFGLPAPPARIEIYDNSHIAGTGMVGAMVVAGLDGFRKAAYRKFNIRKAGAADDYGMMREVMERRFGRAAKAGAGEWPDLVLIDGGKGQLAAVLEVLDELGLAGSFCTVAIAKGPDRHAGREMFFMRGRAMFQLPENDSTLHYLQRLRDEAHRFAIGAQRTRRAGSIARSVLDGVPGVGAKRKKALLLHFGSGEAAARAGIKDLEKVPGVSAALAARIHAHFHER